MLNTMATDEMLSFYLFYFCCSYVQECRMEKQ